MWRTRLRSKGGCNSCRSRRKKCTETKPICHQCQRLELICTWPDPRTDGPILALDGTPTRILALDDLEPVALARLERLLGRKALGHGISLYAPFRDQIQFDLIVRSPGACAGLVTAIAEPGFREMLVIGSLALQNEWLRDALAGFTAYTLISINQGSAEFEPMAMELYKHGISNLQGCLASTQAEDVSLGILLAITMLGSIEALGIGSAEHAVIHFGAAAILCSKFRQASCVAPQERRLYRMLIEAWLYGLATLSIFCAESDRFMKRIDWNVLSANFSANRYDGLAIYALSPFLGGMHDLYRLMLFVSQFARLNLPSVSKRRQCKIWSDRLDELELSLVDFYSELPDEIGNLYRSKALLHIHALRILLLKIGDHTMRADAPAVRVHLFRARTVFRLCSTQEQRNPALAWPLTILLCSTKDDALFGFFREVIEDIRDNFDIGHRRRIEAVLSAIKNRRTCVLLHGCRDSHDSMDLFLQPGGLLMLREEQECT